jgi:hypothetical protein
MHRGWELTICLYDAETGKKVRALKK